MATPSSEIDIIDEALKNDPTDYGDKELVTQNSDDSDSTEVSDTDNQARDIVESGSVVDNRNSQEVSTRFKEQRQEIVDPTTGFKRVENQYADKKGNIVDNQGKILATSGSAARLWLEAARSNRVLKQTEARLAQAVSHIQNLERIQRDAKEIAELPQKLGVSREDYNEGVTLMANWRKNPLEVAREIVARTMTFGYNLSDIMGNNVNDAIEMKALTGLVTKVTDPIRQQREIEERAAQQQRITETAYNNFVSTHEFAEIHGNAIAHLMQTQGLSAEIAYAKIETFAAKNGLDFSKPLEPQITSLAQSAPPARSRTPMVYPGASNRNGSDNSQSQEVSVNSADSSWSEILRDVMRQTN